MCIRDSYYSMRLNKSTGDLVQKVLIPCIDQKLEYMDSRCVEQALWSFKNSETLSGDPVVRKLEELESKKVPKAKIVELYNRSAEKSNFKSINSERNGIRRFKNDSILKFMKKKADGVLKKLSDESKKNEEKA
eukprot:TRINITY_DN10180_c0_g1_i2.p1 TRINITY_DN10180_c0_g1~~TRINITY_DN10180_c0_g1_i2.p1  ORF type:complete len:133 (+),score=34.93 TRINITY_DN10180_c0_g1_i2:73-471(+)